MEIIRLESADSPYFEAVYDWNYAWWGVRDGISPALGMYQLSMIDDLYCRPDLYPWLIDVYVAEPCRGRGVGRALLETVPENARAAGLTELYLYTIHMGLYEKFGWTYVGEVDTFRADSPRERLYKLEL